MDVNVLLRGQSNAQIFAQLGAQEMEQRIERQLGSGVDIRLVYQFENGAGRNTINSGTAFLDWDTDGRQAGFMNYVNSLPESVQDNPTITLWMHNEFDQWRELTTADWVREVRTDAALVRGALEQGASTTPYLFTWVPYPWSEPGSPEKIQTGMRQLAGDAAFNADLALDAMNGISMNGDGYPGSGHMGPGDAYVVAGRLASALAPMAWELTGNTAPVPTTPPPPTTPTAPPAGGVQPTSQTVGSGADSLVLRISQDAYQGSAQYVVVVDGRQVGGTLTASASHASGQSDTITVRGDWPAGSHQVEVRFLNDAWGGSAATDRNLYLDDATYNGAAVGGAAQEISSDWRPGSFSFTEASTTSPTTPTTPTTPPATGGNQPANLTVGSGPDKLVLSVSQDAYQGNAQYTVRVDGVQVGGTLSAAALRSSGQHDTVTVLGDWAGGSHTATVTFLNDAWGGSAATDRNLYVDSATYNGASLAGATAALEREGPANFGFTDGSAPTTPTTPPPTTTPTTPPATGTQPANLSVGSGADKLVLSVSQDAYQGSARYTVSVDGVQIGGTLTASALHSSGQRDTVTVLGDWAGGRHTATVDFLNDAWGGTAATDRNLYVDGATYNGASVSGATASLLSAGPANLVFTDAAPVAPTPGLPPANLTVGSGADRLVLSVSQDAYQGSAQYTVRVDGVQIGGTLTASASHSSGQSDTVTVRGDWSRGDHVVTVTFLNDAWGGSAATDRNLYLDGAAYNGAALSGAAQEISSDWRPGSFGFLDPLV